MKLPKGFTHEVRIGTGSFSYVCRAREEKLDRDVVLKCVRPSQLKNAAKVEREVRTIASLQLSVVPAVYDVLKKRGRIFIAMEWIHGIPLSQLHQYSLSSESYLCIAAGIVGAVARLHDAGYAHRDLKPDNVIITPEGEVTLVDFGFSQYVKKLPNNDSRLQGTPAYMAPELWSQDGDVDLKRADLFSLGKLLDSLPGVEYEVLTQSLMQTDPSKRSSDGKMVEKMWHKNTGNYEADSLRREISNAIGHYTAGLLLSGAKELHACHRLQEAYELLTESLSLWPDFPAGLDFLKRAYSRPWREHQRRQYVTRAVCAALALFVLTAGAYFFGRQSGASLDMPYYDLLIKNKPLPARVKPPGVATGRIQKYRQVTLRQTVESDGLTGTVSIRLPEPDGNLYIDGERQETGSGGWYSIALEAGTHRIAWHDASGFRNRGETVDILPFATRRIAFDGTEDE